MNEALLKQLMPITDEEQAIKNGSRLEKEMYTSGRAFTVDSNKMLEKGKLIAARLHTRFTDFPRHSHNYIEIMYMCSGETTHIINNSDTVTLEKGELLFLNQHACHSIKKAGIDDIAVNFIVLPQFFDDAFNILGENNPLAEFILGSLKCSNENISYLHFKVSDILVVQNLVENMIWSIVNKMPNSRRLNQKTMALLLLTLLDYTDCLDFKKPDEYSNSLVLAALREIEENYKSASLSAVALKSGVSCAYISRIIKEQTGMTFKEQLKRKRLMKAAELLRLGGLCIQDVINAVGYDNTSYFYRIFTEYFKETPGEYKKH